MIRQWVMLDDQSDDLDKTGFTSKIHKHNWWLCHLMETYSLALRISYSLLKSNIIFLHKNSNRQLFHVLLG